MWALMRPFTNDPGVRLVNFAKYRAERARRADTRYRQSHAGFAFLLDYVPDWKRAYGPGGLIQYQSFLPGGDRARRLSRDPRALAPRRA